MCSRAQHVLNKQAWKCFVHFFFAGLTCLFQTCLPRSLYRPANDPGTQMTPKLNRNWFHRKKLGMTCTPWNTYFLNYSRWRNDRHLRLIKVAIKNVKHAAQNTKLTRVDCTNFSIRKRTAKNKKKKNLRRCLCHLINRRDLCPVPLLNKLASSSI